MRQRSAFLAICSLLFVSVIFASTPVNAQSSEQELWSPYWTVANGFQSTLEMKNNRGADALDVTVAAYLPDGTEHSLGTYHLQPRETTTLDLNKALGTALSGSQDWGTLEVKFTSEDVSNVMGSVSVTNPDAGIAWDFRLYATDSQLAAKPLRGVFWLPNNQADGFVAIQNTSEDRTSTVSGKIVAGDTTIAIASFDLPPGGARKLWLRDYLKTAGLKGQVSGGIELTHTGEDALVAHGVMYDMHGFSAETDMRLELGDGTAQTYTLRTPRAAIGAADPVLGLEPDASFKPTLVLHNFASSPLAVNLTLAASGVDSPNQKAAQYQLAANETKLIDLGAVLASQAGKWFSAEVKYQATTNYVGAELVSVAADGKHTLRSMMNHVNGSIREGWYWRVDDNKDTLLSIFNPGENATTARVSLDFKTDSGSGKYDIGDVTIPAHATHIIDIGAYAASGLFDMSGAVIPKAAEGGYRVEAVVEPAGSPRGIVMTEALVFDRKRKTYQTYYNTCCLTSVTHTPSSLGGSVGGTGQMYVSEHDYCTGGNSDVTPYASYSSFNSTIAAAHAGGSANYNAAGSTTLRSSYYWQKWSHTLEECQEFLSNGDRPTQVGPYQIEPIATASQGPAACVVQGQAGWVRNTTNQVQYSNGSAYPYAGLTVADSITVNQSQNGLGIGNPQTSSATTTGDGSFPDTYFVCSSSCPGAGETTALQSWTVNGQGLPHVNGVSYKCGTITVDGR